MEVKILKCVGVVFSHYMEKELFYETHMVLMHTKYMLTCRSPCVHLPSNFTMNEAVLDYLLCPVTVVSDQESGKNQRLFSFYKLMDTSPVGI